MTRDDVLALIRRHYPDLDLDAHAPEWRKRRPARRCLWMAAGEHAGRLEYTKVGHDGEPIEPWQLAAPPRPRSAFN